jgi:tetratricopeptide (TPR) repeat protein
MQEITLYVRSVGIMATLSLIQAIAFTQTSIAIDKTSKSIFKVESQGLLPTFLVRNTSNVQEAVNYYFMLGVQKVIKKDYRGALSDFNRAIQLDPNFPYAYDGRGAIKVVENDVQGALSDFNRAIQLDPNLAGVYKNRAFLKASKLNDLQGGLVDFNRAIQLNPKYSDAYALRGNLKYERLNNRAGGIADIQEAAKLFQQQGKTNDYRKAIEQLKKWQQAGNNTEVVPVAATKLDRQQQFTPIAQNISPKLEEYNGLARQKVVKGDYQGALVDYNRAISIDPNYAKAYAGRGGLKMLAFKDYQGALVDLNRAVQLDPSSTQAYNNRGVLKASHLQDYQGALADLNRVISIDPNDIDAYNNRSLLRYHNLKDRVGGITDLQKVANLFQQRGNQKDAQRAMETVRQWQLETKKAGSV